MPVHDSESEEEEPEAPESPTSPRSPRSPMMEGESENEKDFGEDAEAQSPNPLEQTDNALKKKFNRTGKHKGELVTIKLRNGDR